MAYGRPVLPGGAGPEQLRWAAAAWARNGSFARRHHELTRWVPDEATTEARWVELDVPGGLVDLHELGEGELGPEVAKLSDQEGGIVQRTLQSIAYGLYRDTPVDRGLRDTVEEAWDLLPQPDPIDVTFDSFNTFVSTAGFFSTRADRLRTVVEALEVLDNGEVATSKVITTRYGDGLPQVAPDARRGLLDRLRRHLR